MKTSSLLIAFLLTCSTRPSRIFCQASGEHDYSAPPIRNLKFNSGKMHIATTLDVLPGQEIHIHNDVFVWVRIFSDDPLMVSTGDCKALRTKDIICVISPPNWVNITDIRFGSPLDPELINHVHITALKGLPDDSSSAATPAAEPSNPLLQADRHLAPSQPVISPVDREQLRQGSDGTRTTTFPIYPGQELRVTNPQYRFIKIESDFPVTIQIGSCQFTGTKNASCDEVSVNDPIRIWDLRGGTPPDGGADNRIKITAREHR
jgi:hypothetical protein